LLSNNVLDDLKDPKFHLPNVSAREAAKLMNPRGLVIASTDGMIKFSPMTRMAPNTLYDWTSQGVVTAIKNQGACGSCWAHSATEEIETAYAFAHKQLPPPLAVQQLVDCDTTSDGCGGGGIASAYTYVYDAGGIETDAEYPYTGENGPCNAGGQKFTDITNYQLVGQGNEADMLNFLTSGGPLSICLNDNNLESYTGNNQILPGSTCDPNQVNHCVQLTGWLTDASGNVAAWNIRNSWGTDWGNAGYGLLQYGVNACNIDCYPTFVTVS